MSGRKWSNLGQPGAGNKKFKIYIYIYIYIYSNQFFYAYINPNMLEFFYIL